MTTDSRRGLAFRRLLSREAGASPDGAAMAAAVRRACEHLGRQLAPLVGDAGAAAICTRSLHLVARRHPRVVPAGPPPGEDDPFIRVQRFLQQQEAAVAAEAGAAVLTTMSDLLVLLIGEHLTTRLLREAWPEDFTGDSEETR